MGNFFSDIGDFFSDAASTVLPVLGGIAGTALGGPAVGALGTALGKGIGGAISSNSAQDEAVSTSEDMKALDYNYASSAATIANDRAKEAATTAYERNLTMYNKAVDQWNRRYQATAQDMKRAGLNPILAATGGFSVGSTPNTPNIPTQQTFAAMVPPAQNVASGALDYANLGRAYADTYKSYAETEQAKVTTQKLAAEIGEVAARIRNIDQDTGLKAQEAAESISRIALNRANEGLAQQNERTDAQRLETLLAEARTKTQEVIESQGRLLKMGAEMKQLTAETSRTRADENRIKALQDNIQTATDEITANIKLIKQHTTNAEAIGVELAKIADVYKGPAGATVAYTKAITGAVGSTLSAVTGGIIGRSFR